MPHRGRRFRPEVRHCRYVGGSVQTRIHRVFSIRRDSDETLNTEILGIDGHFGNRNHELATPIADVGVLLNDFVFEIPRQN